MQCGTSHLQRVILTTYRTFTVATVRFTQTVSCNICTHPRCQQVANVSLCNNSSDNKKLLYTQGRCQSICTCHHCHIYAPITAFVTFTPYKFHGAPRTLTWQSCDLVRCNLYGLTASNNFPPTDRELNSTLKASDGPPRRGKNDKAPTG